MLAILRRVSIFKWYCYDFMNKCLIAVPGFPWYIPCPHFHSSASPHYGFFPCNPTPIPYNHNNNFSCNATNRGHIYKLTVPIAKCNRTKYFYSTRVVPAWNSLPGDIVSAPNLLSFKRRLRAINLSKFLILPCILS